MAQLGMLVPATSARLAVLFDFQCSHMYVVIIRLSPVDAIITRMGAYDNMFSHASTFKVELDEWYYPCCRLCRMLLIILFSLSCKILRDATPRSLVILDGVI